MKNYSTVALKLDKGLDHRMNFSNIGWHGGKLLQLIALIQAPYALWVGLSSADAKRELQLLLLAVIQFLIGLFLVRICSRT